MRSAIAFSLLAAVACGGDDGGGGGPDGGPDAGLDADLGTIVEPGDPGAADVRVYVRVDRDRKTISPLIYGVNGGAGRIDCIHNGAGCPWADWAGLFEDGFESNDTTAWSAVVP